jgi:cytochrome c5
MTRLKRLSALALVAASLGISGCGDEQQERTSGADMPTFPDDALIAGRGVWKQTCRACHLTGIAGAPAVSDFAQWEVRLQKGNEALFQSVRNGIRGDDGKYRMPPRGGNDRLTDEQIRLALGYKIAAIEALRQQGQ